MNRFWIEMRNRLVAAFEHELVNDQSLVGRHEGELALTRFLHTELAGHADHAAREAPALRAHVARLKIEQQDRLALARFDCAGRWVRRRLHPGWYRAHRDRYRGFRSG